MSATLGKTWQWTNGTPARVLDALQDGPATKWELSSRLGAKVETVERALVRMGRRGLVAHEPVNTGGGHGTNGSGGSEPVLWRLA